MVDQKRNLILIVDDSPDQINFLTDMLIEKYDVISAFNGHQALEKANAQPQPDLILLDIIIPLPDGYEVCRRLKSDAKTEHIPVILTTGLSGSRNEYDGLKAGASDYISKPYNVNLMHARIQNLLVGREQTEELEKVVRHRTKELKMSQALLIDSMGIMAEFRDPETGAHIKRTQNYVNALAKALRDDPGFEMDLSDEDIRLLHQSAPLHDIGKVGVSDQILLKQGALTKEEFEEMKEHPGLGYRMLKKTMEKMPDKNFFRYALEITYCHHEKWDGSGYPRGLKGEEIPLSGRIMALADVYDALISKRCYKEALRHEEAREIIIKQSGKHFDPRIVMAFLRIDHIFKNIYSTYDDFGLNSRESRTMPQKIRNLLIVDDNEINLEIMRNQLEFLGYKADISDSGYEALDKLKRKDYDLVLTDMDMPKMSGYALVRIINEINPELPVIAVTASDYKLNPRNIKEYGFSGFLLKPFDDEIVIDLISAIDEDLSERSEHDPPIFH